MRIPSRGRGLDRRSRRARGVAAWWLCHPTYCPRFGFDRASRYGIAPSIEAPDEALMTRAIDPAHPLPSGIARYATPFGID
ncbi:hypothetical protein ABZV58_00120 [Nocardia sp. NPDC004654]|uniref:hypothetical protein n=1 Tax=Nocardia sp. NPDC004654 TaxID=3154776 RepID=UPI0033AE3EEA